MPKSPRLTASQVIKQLKSAGFVEASQRGSHLKLFNLETQQYASYLEKEEELCY